MTREQFRLLAAALTTALRGAACSGPYDPPHGAADRRSMNDIAMASLVSRHDAFLPTDKGSRDTGVEPPEQLSIKIRVQSDGTKDCSGEGAGFDANCDRPNRFQLSGRVVTWQVGPRPLYSMDEVKLALRCIAKDPASQVPDQATGGKKRMPCLIEAYLGVSYDDVARTNDAANAAGFQQVHFQCGRDAGN